MRRKLFENLVAYAEHHAQRHDLRGSPKVLLTAVTAPGQNHLPWDTEHCVGLGPHDHDGNLGCRVAFDAATAWNKTAGARASRLHNAVMVRCRREGHQPWRLARVFEIQMRGVSHFHPVLAYTTPREKLATNAYRRHLAKLAPRYGFGFVERKPRVMAAKSAAAYLSAYFVQGSKTKGKISLQESVRHPGMPRSIIHVSPHLTMATGCTMRRLRYLRFCHTRGWKGFCVGETYHALDRYVAHPTVPNALTTVEWMEANATPEETCS